MAPGESASSDPAPRLLLVACQLDPTLRMFVESSGRAGWTVDRVSDVYSAMAQLARPTGEPYDCVVADTRGLDPVERQFLPIARRYFNRVAVHELDDFIGWRGGQPRADLHHVQAPPGAGSELGQAVSGGADGGRMRESQRVSEESPARAASPADRDFSPAEPAVSMHEAVRRRMIAATESTAVRPQRVPPSPPASGPSVRPRADDAGGE